MYMYIFMSIYMNIQKESVKSEINSSVCMHTRFHHRRFQGGMMTCLYRFSIGCESVTIYIHICIYFIHIYYFLFFHHHFTPIWNHHAHIHRHINIFCSYLLSRPCQTRLGNAKYSSPLHLFLNKIADHDVDPSCLSEASLDFVCICRNRVSYILWDLR